ncbi:heme o synthase [Georgenia satyanarayanai]|uniref:heme o synthase n=1 Tax=Georgenia satyanarayanai TaxID=860221 RepID=UPI00386029BF
MRSVQPAPGRQTEEVAPHVSDRSTLRSSPGPAGPAATRADRVKAYVALTKPRIVELLLITTVPTLFLAAGGWPGLWLTVATMIGGYASAGSANTWNMILDRDIDRLMNRTKQRPLVTGVLSVRQATVFAVVLGVFSFLWFGLLVNWASAWLSLAAVGMYVIGYTLLLKRRTTQNIVWGGAAGCMPVLIGWSAVTGTVEWPALVLFGIIFFWTPPHYWPLSMRFKKDYARAEVPMLPVVASDTKVAVQILLYGAAMVACSLALVPVAGMTWVYAVISAVAGAWFIAGCLRLLARARHPERGKLAAMKVFHASITYLTIVFVAVAVDPFLPL